MHKYGMATLALVFALILAPCAGRAFNPPGINHLPKVKISKPLHGVHVEVNLPIHFTATASDIDDCPGEPDCLTVHWSSQEDGTKKTGSSVTFTFTTPGPRHIIATVQDSDG